MTFQDAGDVNARLRLMESGFLSEKGLPGRFFFKHVLQAPGIFLGCEAFVVFPFGGCMTALSGIFIFFPILSLLAQLLLSFPFVFCHRGVSTSSTILRFSLTSMTLIIIFFHPFPPPHPSVLADGITTDGSERFPGLMEAIRGGRIPEVQTQVNEIAAVISVAAEKLREGPSGDGKKKQRDSNASEFDRSMREPNDGNLLHFSLNFFWMNATIKKSSRWGSLS